MTHRDLAATALILLATPLHAQGGGGGRRCQLQIDKVVREGLYVNTAPGVTNYFVGGDVEMSCRGQPVRIWTDSVASYGGELVQFVGRFRYQDETTRLTSDFGTYYRNQERWEAIGNVVYLNTRDGSELRGPRVNYYRRSPGIRETEEAFAEQRPTLKLAARDSTGQREEPYLVVADRVRTRGQDLMWGGGNVTIDRSDLHGRGDSLQLDTGKAGAGALIGHAALRNAATDSFSLAGKRIDLELMKRELTGITGHDSATLTSKDLDLKADAVRLKLESRKVVQTLAWGKTQRPQALADDYEVRGDSLAVDSPGQVLKELRAFRNAWIGFRPDSAKGERDWLSGEVLIAEFVQRQTQTGSKSAIRRLEAKKSARSFYRVVDPKAPRGLPSITTAKADRIVLTMQLGDSAKVERVEMTGNVEGAQLEPRAVKPDSTRRDSTANRPRKP